MKATNLYGMSQHKWPEKDSLFFKFQGHSPAALEETARVVRKVTERYGGFGFTLAKNEQEAEVLWIDRKNALYSSLALLQDSKGWSTDVWYGSPLRFRIKFSLLKLLAVFQYPSCLILCTRRNKT